MRIYLKASLVPATAVITAAIAYIKVVAVKKLIVGSRAPAGSAPFAESTCLYSSTAHVPVFQHGSRALSWVVAW